jgi:lactate 2-monooxygenase
MSPEPTPTPARQSEIYLSGMRGERPRIPANPLDLEAMARRVMRGEAFAYIAAGAGTSSTVQANRAALDRIRIVPRMLRDVSVRDTSIELFGARLPFPLVLSPVGVLELAHHAADAGVARAAARERVPMIFSSQASVPMEACASAMGNATRWFQLYWSKDDELVDSFVRRAETCGCSALVVTLDTTLLGWRPRDLDLGYLPFLRGMGIAQYTSDPVFMSKLDQPLPTPAPAPRATIHAVRNVVSAAGRVPGSRIDNLRSGRALKAVRRFIATYSRPSLSWDEISGLRARTRLPIVLKGILHPDDARRALDLGVSGIFVSNHGGRQVDGSIAAAEALPAIVRAVNGAAPIIMDSGIRGGADIFRALALGATAVGIGRNYAYALAIAGENGVRELLGNLHAEFELTMALAGCTSVAEIMTDSIAHP